jgi:hypothetical protein
MQSQFPRLTDGNSVINSPSVLRVGCDTRTKHRLSGRFFHRFLATDHRLDETQPPQHALYPPSVHIFYALREALAEQPAATGS